MSDHFRTPEDRRLKQEIDSSLKVSSYLSEVAEAITTGQSVKPGMVPDYSEISGPQPHHINMNTLFADAASSLGNTGMDVALSDVHAPRHGDQQTFKDNTQMPKTASAPLPESRLSHNQQRALEKFPALIEMLGQDQFGEAIASIIAGKVREITAQKIQDNTQSVNKKAAVCIAKNKNIKMYFKSDSWVCCVTASGPFRGDEVIQYNYTEDKHYILRLGGDESITDVTSDFDVVHELADVENSSENTE